jgi:hypothetical protein
MPTNVRLLESLACVGNGSISQNTQKGLKSSAYKWEEILIIYLPKHS